MATGSLSAWRVATEAWRLASEAARQMPRLSRSTLVAALALGVIEAWVGRQVLFGHLGPLEGLVARVVQAGLPQLVWASCAIAVHRFVLLAERSDRPVWQVPGQYWPFFDRLMLLQLLVLLPSLVLISGPMTPLARITIGAIGAIVAFIVTLRSMLLFPAVAINAAGAGWRNAWRDSQGQGWLLFRLVWCVAAPIAPVYLGTIVLGMRLYGLQSVMTPLSPWGIFQSCILQAAYGASIWAAAAAASILFNAFGVALKQP